MAKPAIYRANDSAKWKHMPPSLLAQTWFGKCGHCKKRIFAHAPSLKGWKSANAKDGVEILCEDCADKKIANKSALVALPSFKTMQQIGTHFNSE